MEISSENLRTMSWAFRGGTVEMSTVEPPWWPGYQLSPLA